MRYTFIRCLLYPRLFGERDRTMTSKFRWGILGTGNIAKQFARGLAALEDAELVAVGSRTQESADRFGDEFNAQRRYATYEALVSDPDVEAIYISTPHPYHYHNAMLCLDAGKAVLCEKPFAINASEAEQVIAKAREKRLFMMEAMWTRFIPAMVRVRQIVKSGMIGGLRMLTADFGFRTGFNPQHRLFNPDLGGGALLDVGIYPISLASILFGMQPTHISSSAHLGETGVDEQSAYLFSYPNGQIAQLSSATRTQTPQEAYLLGTEGWIKIHSPWWIPRTFTLALAGKEPEVIDMPYAGNGYNYEASAVAACVREGALESDIMPLDETLALMRTLDAIRAQWGLVYPMERR
jgi:dihydrodiol dehydrogenase / D-xylose 1-dehydrogenase (NADP)